MKKLKLNLIQNFKMNNKKAKDIIYNALMGYVEDSAGAESEEAKEIQQAWEKLNEKPELSIEVHCSESDLQDLQEFKEFNWRFETLEDSEQSVNVRLFQGDEPDE